MGSRLIEISFSEAIPGASVYIDGRRLEAPVRVNLRIGEGIRGTVLHGHGEAATTYEFIIHHFRGGTLRGLVDNITEATWAEIWRKD